jgi:hypothetical protein
MIAYRVYGNVGSGGPVDYSTVLQDSPTTTFAMILSPGQWSFGVRAYDSTSGLEEMNTDAVVDVVIGSDLIDHTSVPNAPIGLTTTATVGGGCSVNWAYATTGQPGAPTAFDVWLWPAGGVNWSVPPAATVPANLSRGDISRHYSASLSGLIDGASYAVGVRAVNAAGSDGNTQTVDAIGSSGGPAAVVGLTASPGYSW